MNVMTTAVWTSCWKPVGDASAKWVHCSPPRAILQGLAPGLLGPGPGRPPSRLPALSCQSPFLKVFVIQLRPLSPAVSLGLARSSHETSTSRWGDQSSLISTSPQSTKLSSQQL